MACRVQVQERGRQRALEPRRRLQELAAGAQDMPLRVVGIRLDREERKEERVVARVHQENVALAGIVGEHADPPSADQRREVEQTSRQSPTLRDGRASNRGKHWLVSWWVAPKCSGVWMLRSLRWPSTKGTCCSLNV